MRKEILDRVPLDRLFLMHRKNRYYLEGKAKWTAVEKNKLFVSIALFTAFLAWVVFCYFTIRYSPPSWNPPSYLLAVLFGLFILCFCGANFLKFLKANNLRKNAKLIVGKISGHKFDPISDTRHLVLYYAFTKDGKIFDGITNKVIWNDPQYFSDVKFRLLSYGDNLVPAFDDFVIVQLNEQDGEFDVL